MATPTITGYSNVIGVGGTASIVGTNDDGVITITVGATPVGLGGMCTVSLNGLTYPTQCVPVIFPSNYSTCPLAASIVLPSSVPGGFDINTLVHLVAGTTYQWNYHCGGF